MHPFRMSICIRRHHSHLCVLLARSGTLPEVWGWCANPGIRPAPHMSTRPASVRVCTETTCSHAGERHYSLRRGCCSMAAWKAGGGRSTWRTLVPDVQRFICLPGCVTQSIGLTVCSACRTFVTATVDDGPKGNKRGREGRWLQYVSNAYAGALDTERRQKGRASHAGALDTEGRQKGRASHAGALDTERRQKGPASHAGALTLEAHPDWATQTGEPQGYLLQRLNGLLFEPGMAPLEAARYSYARPT